MLPYEAERARLERGVASDMGASGAGRSTLGDLRPRPPIAEPVWQRYGAVAVVDRGVQVIGDDPSAVYRLCKLLEGPEVAPSSLHLHADVVAESEAQLREKSHTALEWIVRGELYQVSLAHRLCSRSKVPVSSS